MAGVLAGGYLAVWGAFSLAASLAQWGFEWAGVVAQGSTVAGPALAGGILLACGLYQLTPLKRACLRRCRSPVDFIAAFWRPTALGAFRTGLLHGAFCVGCCWFLMALLFAVGAMNLLWVAAIAVLVFAEKLLPYGVWIGRAWGAAMVAFGVWLVTQ
jgi:predicted metal-binding membrane protein